MAIFIKLYIEVVSPNHYECVIVSTFTTSRRRIKCPIISIIIITALLMDTWGRGSGAIPILRKTCSFQKFEATLVVIIRVVYRDILRPLSLIRVGTKVQNKLYSKKY